MNERLILLPGWGLGAQPLQALVAALQALRPQLKVEVAELPMLRSDSPRDWIAALDQQLDEHTWLGGWSLGGMLAAVLAALRGERCRGLLTFASNPCFVADSEWPWAMPESTFNAFVADVRLDAPAALKRFTLLCSQGSAQPRTLAKVLQEGCPNADSQMLLATLEVLGSLDARQAITRFNGPQMHFLAAADALVPVQVAAELTWLLPDIEVGVIEGASHAFVHENAHELAASICAFMSEAADA